MNIAGNLEHAARLFGDDAALIFEENSLTYRELEEQSGRLAAALALRGIAPGDRVVLFLPNIPAFAIAYFAIQKTGAIAVSINSRSTPSEVRFLLEDCGARIVFVSAETRPAVPLDGVVSLEEVVVCEGAAAGGDLSLAALLEEGLAPLGAVERRRDDPAVILYTSGTTGAPKGATLSHGNVNSNLWSFVHNCGMRPGDRFLLPLPLFHCFGQNALLNSGLAAGATLVLQRAFRPETVVAALAEERITHFFGVPAMFLALLETATPASLATVRYCFSAAAKLPEEAERRWLEKFGRPIMQGYGLTETSPFASYNGFLRHRPGTIGTPIENVEMKILDPETGGDLPAGALGEIAIKGPNVMLGYWNRPVETAEVLRDGWFRSGDIGMVDEDGYFHIADRLKDMIDVGGMNVYPVQVENVLYEHGAVAEAAVFGVPDDLMGEQVRACVVLKPGSTDSPEQLIDFCRAKLAPFKVPTLLEVVEEIPRNPSGKILKRILREKALERQEAVFPEFASACLSAGPEERRRMIRDWLVGELGGMLDLPAAVIDDGDVLADLGLESLAAVGLGARLRQRLGIEFSAISLLNGATVGSLSGVLAESIEAIRGRRN
jgi:long-chain acyl-CoA synthetase